MSQKKIVFFFCLFASTLSFSQTSVSPLRCIQAVSILPKFNPTGKVTGYDTNVVRIYIMGGNRLYDLQYRYRKTVNGEVLLTETRRHYVLYKNGDSYGYNFDVRKSRTGRVKLDSLFEREWIVSNKLYPILTSNISILTSTRRDKQFNIVDRYLIKLKADSSDAATCTFTYTSKLSNIDVSLSRELDSIRNMKLCDVVIDHFSKYFKEANMTMDRYYTKFSLQETPVKNEKEILSFFAKLNEQ